MFRPRSPRWFRAIFVVLVIGALVGASISIAQDPTPPAKPKELTREQQEKLRERDRLKAEVEKLRKEEKLTEAVAACEKQLAIEREVFGDLHDDVVGSLNQLAELHEECEDWAAAKKHREEILRIQTKRYGEQDWRVGDARRARADSERLARMPAEDRRELTSADRLAQEEDQLNQQGKYREAAELARKYVDIRRRVLGREHPDTATSLNNLGYLLLTQGDYAGRHYLEQTLAIRKKVLGPEHPGTAESLSNLGYVLQSQGDYAGARPYYEQALAIQKKVLGPENRDTARSLNNLGDLFKKQGDYAGARPYFEQSLAIRKKVMGPEHPDTAQSLNNLGVLLHAQGDFAGARLYLEQAVAIRKEVQGPEHPDTAASLNNLGDLFQGQGDYAGARPYFEQALAIRKKVLGPEHPNTATSLNSLGLLLEAQGDYAGARPYFEQGLAIWKKVLGPEHRDTATSLNNLGLLLEAQGDYAGARPYLEQALAIRKKVLGPEHPHTARSLNNLGYLLQAQGDYGGARPYYEQTQAILKKVLGPNHPDTAKTLSNLGCLHQANGDYAGARPYHAEALAITQNMLSLAADALSERQQLAMADSLRDRLDSCLSVAAGANVAAKEAYVLLLQTKGATLARQHRLRLARQEPELKETWELFQSVSSRLATLSFASPNPKGRDIWRRQLDDATQEKEQLEVKLMRDSAAFRKQKELQRLSPEQLQKALPGGMALVDFLEYSHLTPRAEGKGKLKVERHVLAFVVRPDKPIVQLDLGPAAPVAAAVEEWRKQYRTRDSAPAAELRRLLWEPLAEHVNNVNTVLLSPDGVLARLPFAALPGKEPGSYLLEERAIVVVPVPQLLPELFDSRENADGKDPSLLLVGDVDYGAAPGKPEQLAEARPGANYERTGVLGNWNALPGTREEVDTIRDSFKRRFDAGKLKVLNADKATENALRQEGPKNRYLHLATHGFFADKQIKSALAPMPADKFRPGDLFQHGSVTGFHPGLLSGLVLTGANAEKELDQDDGILTALEVASLDLTNVELAVLSACETGLGEVAGGEGLLGLQRAFQTAGARSVVAGLWKVPDRATQMLMTKFYENLWDKKMSKLEALRQAQIWMLREVPKDEKLLRDIRRDLGEEKSESVKIGDGPLPPYYWAGFVLSGDWR